MTITKTTAPTRRTAAKAVSAAAEATTPRRTRKATASAAAEPKLYQIHSLEPITIDTRVRQTSPLDQAEARKLTEQIQATSVRLWLLVTEAHDRKAHLALGYDTWADYVKAELNMSESRSYQYLDTGHVMKALAAGGVDIEKAPVPPTRVVARVKDRLTDVRRVAEKASKGDGDPAEVDKAIRALAREPRKTPAVAPRGRAAAQAAEATMPTKATAAATATDKDLVTCPACAGSGKVNKNLAGLVKELMDKVRSG